MHITTRGRADTPALLLLHGFLGTHADWEPVADRLAEHFHLILPDLPGHGRSVGLPEAAYRYDAVVRALAEEVVPAGAARVGVVGYSMGGRLALGTALALGRRCGALVLESASPGLAEAAARAARRAVDAERAEAIERDFSGFLERWYRQPLFATLGEVPGRVEKLVSERTRQDPHEVARALRGAGTGRQPSWWERLATLPVTTLALAGARDPKYVDLAQRTARLIPDGRHVIIPEAGHNVHLERPQAFLEHVLAFLDQHPFR